MIAFTIFMAIFVISSKHIKSYASKAEFTYTLDDGYPIGKKLFGSITGVDIDQEDNIILFHRGSHVWNGSTFNANDEYRLSKDSPIPEETVVTIDSINKKVIRAWGRDLFFMPHGLSLDLSGKNLWLTDVALHQVFKYSIDGSKQLVELGTRFVPGNDESHFCKPTSVADTGDYVFVADGYCNSRIVMFSAEGKYLGEFGQSSDAAFAGNTATVQPTFDIPHKITYAKEAKMLCVADRENGRIQCFSFEPKQDPTKDIGPILNGAIKFKFTIADPLFNGRLFSLDYSPIKGGIIVAVSGESYLDRSKKPLGFVYNVTTGQLISRFAPPAGRSFGMAHDVVVSGNEAESLYVADVVPVNLWRFSRHQTYTKQLIGGINQATSLLKSKDSSYGMVWYLVIFSVLAAVMLLITKTRKLNRYSASNSFSTLYSNSYPASINSLFGGTDSFQRRATTNSSNGLISTMFSRRPFFNLLERNRQQRNDFSRIPLEESDNSDDDKSDSDVEEFNINQANPSIKIDV